MAMLHVVIREIGGRETPAELPDDQLVSEIVQILISKMGLPTHQHGEPLRYALEHIRSQTRLDSRDTLASVGAQDSDVLLLLAEPRAGAAGK
jgi:hypothetical protein